MKQEQRSFSSAQRTALYLAAAGLCESCGVTLRPGWHADHVHPFSKGGSTDVVNGAALCSECNIKKGAQVHSADPRETWQREAVAGFMASEANYLVTACPGAGKTRMALKAAAAMRDDGLIDRVIVVANNLAVKSQWAEEAKRFGFDLTEKFRNGDGALPADCDGVVTVYAAVASAPHVWRILACRGVRTLVIMDEVHHCAEADHTSWGPALAEAFSDASRRLLLSGTPFRTDGIKIPFVTYDDAGRAIAGYEVSYKEGVRCGYVRPVRFEVMNGTGEWMRGMTQMSAMAASATEADEGGLLSALYLASGNWIPSVMAKANDELTRLREEVRDAGALLVAENRMQARTYAALLSRLCGEPVDVVMSENDEAVEEPSRIIRNFRTRRTRWIVAVDMISEGVDISRLAVVMFASRKRTEMWFRQIIGRCVRRNGDDITATVFIPALSGLVEMAARIEDEADQGLREAVERIGIDDWDDRQNQRELTLPLGSSDAVLERVITRGDTFDDSELSRAARLIARVGGSFSFVHPSDLAKALRLHESEPRDHREAPSQSYRLSGDDLRMVLRQQVNVAVNRRARALSIPQSHIHSDLNRVCGDTLPTASAESLRRRIEVLRQWP